MSCFGKLPYTVFYAAEFITDDAVNIRDFDEAVDCNDGNLCGCFCQMRVIAFFTKRRADEDDCIDMLIEHELQIFLFFREFSTSTGQDDIKTAFAQVMLCEGNRFGEISIGYICAEYANHFHGIQTKTTGKGVGRIVLLVHGSHNFLACFWTYFAAAVQDTGYCGNRNAAGFCNVIYCHLHSLLGNCSFH